MTFTDVVKSIPGLTHYYPLTDKTQAQDMIGAAHGVNHGAVFGPKGAKFDGKSSIQLPDDNDFSVATKGGLTILVFLTISDWKGAGASEYVHWAGKGKSNAHEYSFRHYVKGGSGEAGSRQGRVSFYHFNPVGGLGAGSYYQDSSFPTTERVITTTCDMRQLQMYVGGILRDTDALSGYNITPRNTTTPVCLGTRGDNTGFLIGTLRRLAFFNRVLSAAEVKKLSDAASQDDEGTTPTPTPVPTPILTPLEPNASLEETVTAHNLLLSTLKTKGVL